MPALVLCAGVPVALADGLVNRRSAADAHRFGVLVVHPLAARWSLRIERLRGGRELLLPHVASDVAEHVRRVAMFPCRYPFDRSTNQVATIYNEI
jgi:hypothetical protein